MSDQSVSTLAEVMRPMAISMFREMLVGALTPLFGTSEQRTTARAQVDAMSDTEIEERMERWTEAVSKFCPECHRPYELTVTTSEERDAALEAVRQYDYATGRRVEFDTDHVHAVSNRDEGG